MSHSFLNGPNQVSPVWMVPWPLCRRSDSSPEALKSRRWHARQNSFSFWWSQIIPIQSGRNYGFNAALNLCWRSPLPNMTFPCRRDSLNDTKLLFTKRLQNASFWKIPQYFEEAQTFLRVVFTKVWSRIRNFKSAFGNLFKAVTYNQWIEPAELARVRIEKKIYSFSLCSFTRLLYAAPFLTWLKSLARHRFFMVLFRRTVILVIERIHPCSRKPSVFQPQWCLSLSPLTCRLASSVFLFAVPSSSPAAPDNCYRVRCMEERGAVGKEKVLPKERKGAVVIWLWAFPAEWETNFWLFLSWAGLLGY